jgi:hypothetical protein
MSEAIVLFVTRDGHSRALALDLGARLGSEVREIGDLEKRKGLFGWLRSGRQAAMGEATPIGDPQVDLSAVKSVALVQPVWASAICPPIRTWLRAHEKELDGKRVAILSSAYSTPPLAIRGKYEAEFGARLGALAACSVVNRKDGPAERERALGDFAAELAKR